MIRVLIVDDERSLLELARDFLLRDDDLLVDTAESAHEALEKVSTFEYDAIISDYQMPDMNGIAMLERLRGEGNPVPFILFTGRGREEVVIDALNKGADFYLRKGGAPQYQFAELRNMILQAVSRRKAEEALEHNARRFKSLIEHSSDILCLIDGECRIQYLSPSVRRVLGYDPREIVGRVPREIVHPRDTSLIKAAFARLRVRPDGVERIEVRLRNRAGRYRIIEAEMTLDQNWGDSRAIINARDVTDRKRMEKALVESQERYRMVTESSPLGVYIFQDGRFKFINEAMVTLYGHTKEELLDLSIDDLVHPDFVDRVKEMTMMALRGEDENLPRQFEFLARRKGDEPVWVRINPSLVSYEGRPAILGNLMDVNEQRKAQEALRESEERYRTIFENTGSATAIIERDMVLSLVNDEFTRLTGYTKEEIEGRMISMDVVAESDRPRLVEYHRLRRVDPALAPREYEFSLLTKEGASKDCRAIISVFPGTGQSIVSLVDLSEQKRMQRELQTRSVETSKLLDSIDVQVWYAVDPETYGIVNKARADYLGLPRDEIEGRKLSEIMPPENWEMCMEGNRRAFRGERVYQEEWIRSREGELRCFHVSKIPKLNDEGEVEHIVCTATDITDLKSIASTLHEEREQFLSLLESIDSPIYVADMDSNEILFANSEVANLLGEVVGRKCYEAIRGRDGPCES